MWTRAVLEVARRPSLWPTAARQAARMTPTAWWRRAPFLPLPDAAYLRFRLHTQYGETSPTGDELARDLVAYLRWCRDGGN